MKRYYQILYRDHDNNINTSYIQAKSKITAHEEFISNNEGSIVDNISEVFESTEGYRFLILKEVKDEIYISNLITNKIYYIKLGN
ncbi:hypothetical protein GKR75_08175, partial [Providencia sp. wls1919]|nr:hypothetical protein [Providencia sp. wls1919]